MEELERVQILSPPSFPILQFGSLRRKRASKKRLADQMNTGVVQGGERELELSNALLQVAELSEGFSGRALRKLPFQAHAFFIQVSNLQRDRGGFCCDDLLCCLRVLQSRLTSATEFVQSLARTVEVEKENKKRLVSE